MLNSLLLNLFMSLSKIKYIINHSVIVIRLKTQKLHKIEFFEGQNKLLILSIKLVTEVKLRPTGYEPDELYIKKIKYILSLPYPKSKV